MMDFCSKCGSRLVPKVEKKDEEAILICEKCGFKKSGESIKTQNIYKPKSEDQIVVIGKKEQKLQTLPTVATECPKCSNNSAYVWEVQTRGSDESSTQFFRCTKCYYTYREYS
jgi:DNA-directed RNA polymerase subunit M